MTVPVISPSSAIGSYDPTAPVFDPGPTNIQTDERGYLQVNMLDGSTSTPVAFGFTPQEITTATTTLVKTGAGMIGDITVNKSGTTDTITVYDALTATGTPIATIVAPTVGMKFCELYKFTTGLTIVTGGTPGNYTVSYQ